jgi:hypothetical protein
MREPGRRSEAADAKRLDRLPARLDSLAASLVTPGVRPLTVRKSRTSNGQVAASSDRGPGAARNAPSSSTDSPDHASTVTAANKQATAKPAKCQIRMDFSLPLGAYEHPRIGSEPPLMKLAGSLALDGQPGVLASGQTLYQAQ